MGNSTSSSNCEMSVSAPFTTAPESQPPQEAKLTVKSPAKKTQVKIIIHGKTKKEIVLEQKDYTKTVEDVCVRLLKDNYENLGPAAVQLFGLASFDSKRSPKIIWKNPSSTFQDVVKNQENQNYEYYLRLRFVPKYEEQLEKLPNFGSDLVRYLFYQCSDDYVKDRLKKIFGKHIDNGPKKRGYAVLHMSIEIKEEGKDGPEYIKKYKKMEDFLPPAEIPRHFWNLFKKLILEWNIKDQLDKHWESCCRLPVEELMLAYIRDVVQMVGIYGIEQYQADKVDGTKEKKEVSLVINVHTKDADMKGLYLDETLFSRIEDFHSVSIIPAVQSTAVNVHLDRSEGHSQVLGFTSMEVAESFVSGLNGYYRLLSDYYMSLCQQVEPPSQKTLTDLRCHGPVETDYAVEKLKHRYSDEQYYILKQHVTAFNSYDIIFSYQQQYRRLTIHKEKGKFRIEKDEERFDSLKKLINHMVEVRMALPSNPQCVRPRPEPCHNLRRLFFKEECLIPDEDMEDKMMAARALKQPVVFLTTDIQLEPNIDLGRFTEVRTGYLHDGRKVAVKTLRKTKPEQMFMCYEHLRRCTEKMIQIEEPKFFVGVCGIQLSTPPALVMENAQFGSLHRFFQQRKPDQPIYLHHLLTASIQIASGLLYLQEHNVYHGNICCHNILLFKYAIDEIHVKIGDPGMVSLLNTQSIDYEENRRRVPWLAPELLNDMNQMTTQSDMYAFGTTMWEMFSFGKNPVDTMFRQFDSTMVSYKGVGPRNPQILPATFLNTKVNKKYRYLKLNIQIFECCPLLIIRINQPIKHLRKYYDVI
ncbi:hypothetical protein FSP39_024808 [Pinctada imbricata]|uniref:Non-specific protein-tyrosine kinase n=1 Tax=Pinctada imbricata TaxID=66713 RepID=A0AA88XNW5_PINIB|nr:hypothetical protein FSP39_024808 [Pinctada imbricata]